MASPSATPNDTDDGETAYLEARLPHSAAAPREAREAVSKLCDAGALPASVRPDLLLLVSEVVTIAVLDESRSAETPLVLTAARNNGLVRVTLADSGRGFTERAEQTESYGIYLLDQVATRWGVEALAEGDAGTRVWFELTTKRDPYSHARQHRLAI